MSIPRGGGESAPPLISVVAPAFNEEGNIEPLYAAVKAGMAPLRCQWELVLADDGSTDGTWPRIAELHVRDDRVRGIRLSRNFGHQQALLAGLAHARGAAVVSLDADLQHPPALIPELVERWRQGAMVVHTIRRDSRRLPWSKRLTSRLFYRLYSLLSGSGIQPGMSDFRLLDRRVLDELLRFGEEEIFLRGLVHWIGYPSDAVPFEPDQRHSGTTKYPFRRMLKFAWTGVTSFSVTPLRFGILLGVLTSAVAFAAILYAIGAHLLGVPTVPGWASVLSILSFLFGVLFIFLGIIGEYVGKILIEVKRRPRFLVQDRIGESWDPRRMVSKDLGPPEAEADRASGVREGTGEKTVAHGDRSRP